MYLINAKTLELEHFIGRANPLYAILSHTWGDAEVTYDQFRGLKGDLDGERAQELSGSGLSKIRMACAKTLEARLFYVWVDTCCIDKRSSAELSEAINSMFSWYQKAAVCFVYLEDVEDPKSFANLVLDRPITAQIKECLMHAKWFTRGWTLQELLAPGHLVFCDKRWTSMGTKAELASVIADITGIEEPALLGIDLDQYSVALRMSWAANRHTTRIEDEAYSLLGIFDINMPLLYGEGEKAFTRLQEEIMRDSNDQSLFAWTPSGGQWWVTRRKYAHTPVFARSAQEFEFSKFLVPFLNPGTFALTNNGVKMHAPILPFHDPTLSGHRPASASLVLLVLNCYFTSDELKGQRVAIVCRWTDHTETQLDRDPSANLCPITNEAFRKAQWTDVYLLKKKKSTQSRM